MPLFSVFIPTRNRAKLVFETVQHTLALSFQDIEVVVIDNDDTPATSHALAQITDKRLRVVRTGGLAMPENLEEGFKAASGEYLYMQSDRLRLEKNILEYIAARVVRHRPDVMKCTQGVTVPRVRQLQDDNGWSVLPSEWVISFILNSDIAGMYNVIPNCYSTFYSKRLVRSIQEKYGRMAARITPDFTAAYSTLFSVKEIHHTKRHAFRHISQLSTGTSFQYGGELGNSCLRKIGVTVEEMVQYAKIPVTTIPLNTVFSDFFAISRMMNQKYTHDDMDDVNYVIFLFRQLMQSKYYYHIDVSEDLRKVYNFLEETGLMGTPRITALFEEFNMAGVGGFTKRRFLKRWQMLAIQGARVAIYGASPFTQWLEQATLDEDQPKIVAVIDQMGGDAPDCFGRTPIFPGQFDPSTADLILVSSEKPASVHSIVATCRKYYGDDVKLSFVDLDFNNFFIKSKAQG